MYRILCLLAVAMFLNGSAASQTDHWTIVQFGNLQCEFPKPYTPIEFTGASGIYYDGGNVYLTVTALPDTSSMKGNLDRDYTRDFMVVVADVSRKLNGRVREFRDTVISNMPGYISKMEISFKDGRNSYYELLQVLQQDSIRGFSCQYYDGDTDGTQAASRFFQSIKAAKPRTSKSAGNYGYWIGGGLLVVFGVWAFLRRRSH